MFDDYRFSRVYKKGDRKFSHRNEWDLELVDYSMQYSEMLSNLLSHSFH